MVVKPPTEWPVTAMLSGSTLATNPTVSALVGSSIPLIIAWTSFTRFRAVTGPVVRVQSRSSRAVLPV